MADRGDDGGNGSGGKAAPHLPRHESSTIPRYPGLAPIDAYGDGGFRFAGMSHRGSIICLPDAIEAWPVTTIDGLDAADLARVLALAGKLDLVLFGTGKEHCRPSPEIRQAFAEIGLALDVMSTGAAARTWNVLIAEGRPVAALLIAVD